MTIGIYALFWEEQDLIYVGLSIDIEKRFKRHKSDMSCNRHGNYKVQNTYNLYGKPVYSIVEVCSPEELPFKEIFWTNEFNSLNSGLNIVEAGSSGFGANSSGSKYTALQIIKAFRLLYLTNLTHLEISRVTGVSVKTIGSIQQGGSHIDLKVYWPYQYSLMKTRRTKLNNCIKHVSGVTFISPDGTPHTTSNISEFAKVHNLNNSHLYQIILGNRFSHKGWVLA